MVILAQKTATCQLCGLEQPADTMAVDAEGRRYCPDLMGCWHRWDRENGLESREAQREGLNNG